MVEQLGDCRWWIVANFMAHYVQTGSAPIDRAYSASWVICSHIFQLCVKRLEVVRSVLCML